MTQSLKNEPRIKNDNYTLCKVHCENDHLKRQIYQNKAKNLCKLFVFHLDGGCKFIKNKTLQ